MNTNATLYYAVMNILDYIALNEDLDKDVESELDMMLDDLCEIGNIDIPSLAEANDCGDCETFPEVVEALRELFKNGDRIAID